MKILITGNDGQIGSNLNVALQELHEVVHFDAKQGQNVRNTYDVEQAVEGCEVVVHLAAIPWAMGDKSSFDYWENNIKGTWNVLRAAIKAGAERFVLASSTGVYGYQRGFPMSGEISHPWSTTALQNFLYTPLPDMSDPIHKAGIYYMMSKTMAEQLVAMEAYAGNIKGVILRLAPLTPTPYEWGLQCTMKRAVLALDYAATCNPALDNLQIYNVGEECDVLDTVTLGEFI